MPATATVNAILPPGAAAPVTRPWKVQGTSDTGISTPWRSFATEEAARAYADRMEAEGRWDVIAVQHGELRPPRACACTCGEQTEGGLFRPGHDRRLASLGEAAATGDKDALARFRTYPIPVRTTVHATYDEEVRCGAECMFAHREVCRCSCSGANHQAGWAIVARRLETTPTTPTPAARTRGANGRFTPGGRTTDWTPAS